MTPRARRTVLYGTLLATGLAAYLAPTEEEPVEPVRTSRDKSGAPPNADQLAELPVVADPASTLKPQKRTALSAAPKDLFYFEPPPAVAQADPEPAVQPTPPPFPYAYMGKSVGRDRITIFLTRDEKPYVAHLGDILDGQYRIDAINPPVLEFTYLPLAQKQMLLIGAAE